MSADTDDRARTAVEQYGVEYIPEEDRTSRPLNLFTNLFGSNLTFAAILLGYVQATLGLSWWATFSAIIAGTAVGAVILAPTALLGPRTGTNGPVSAGVFFGVIGRLNGTLISVCASVGFFAISVWTGGQVIVYGGHQLFGMSDGKVALAISYALMAIVCAYTTIVGHDHLVRLNRWLIPTAGTLILIGFFVYAGRFHNHQLSPSYALGGYWPTWTLAMTIGAASVFGYSIFTNDWTRYISRRRHSDLRVAGALGLGGFLGVAFSMTFGAFTAYAIGNLNSDYISGLMGITPTAFMVPVILIGFAGTLGQGALCLYGSGLDLASILRRISRPVATLILSGVAVVFVYLGGLVWNIKSSVEALVTILGVVTAAWAGIVIAGLIRQRGDYDVRDLQVFNEGRRGGKYWYWGGVNAAGMTAWVAGSVVGLMFYRSSVFSGPWSMLANGVNLSWLSAGVVAGVLYPILSRLIPGQ
ncbi:purine-cytosine permease family protein [Amycolatopsis jejuensis]|uniref:purine-cytosine permease family protein n=1 Tax=Amycolatopsis jejuensis TaxID=330084 RepID=UPI00138DE23B|nr:cytosine permease [Amycolatopsis jejuensis]